MPSPAVAAGTTSVIVTKYDAYGNVIGSPVTHDYTWLEANLPVQGTDLTRRYHQGPTFDDSSYNALWDPGEMVNIDSRDYGRAKGTDVKDLCNLVGGATAGDVIKITATDNFAKWFDYEDIYSPEAAQGKLVVCWYNEDFGGYVPGYSTGMRLLFFAETLNPDGKHVFGDWDMHNTLPMSRWHFYYDGKYWPSSSGLSVQNVAKIEIFQPKLISCDAIGNAKDSFAAGETVYVKGVGLSGSTSYKLWLQKEPVTLNARDAFERPAGPYVLNGANDPSGSQEAVTTNGGGDFGPIAIWIIPTSATANQYDIVADNQASGTTGTYDSYDAIDNPGWKGFATTLAPVAPVAPVAAFTANVTSGTAPLTVNFSDASTGTAPLSYAWDFDNNGVVDSTIQNPSHVYAAGTYTVKLTVTNTDGSDDEVKTNYITVNPAVVAPTAAFSSTPTSGTAPLTVNFSDASTGTAPLSYAWDFDNNGVVDSTIQNPSHVYAAGTYSVKLTVTNAGGSDDEIKANYITVNPAPVAPVAAFSANITSGTAPLSVSFTDQSTNTPTSWAWDFDNNGSVDSNLQNPSHVYAAGTYSVKLTVTNAGGSDDEIKANYITVNPAVVAPTAAFSGTPTSGTAPLSVSFTDQSTNTPTSWAWDFDNNGSVDSNLQNPSHVYAAGTYSVKLVVTNVAGSDDEIKANYITVNLAPVAPTATFSGTPTGGTAPLTVNFTDTSTGTAPLSYAWDFDNNGVVDSTIQNPSHVYAAGTYSVKLTVTNTAGSDDEIKANYIIVNPAPVAPVAAFSANVTSGMVPLSVGFTDQSTNTPTSWAWDFNNDSTADSTERNPTYTYDAAGTYTVKLTVTNIAGSGSEVKTDYITVTVPTMVLLWGPYLTGTTTTGTVVNVKTTLAATATVEYATEAEYAAGGTYDYMATDGVNTQLHHIVLSGLDPNTIYHYRVLYGTEYTADFHFSTFPTSGSFTFVVLSDTQDQVPLYSQSERFKLVADSIAEWPDVAFVLIVGDLINDGSDTANWNRFFDAGRLMLANTTICPALGNHEENSTLYYDIFGPAEYYSFDCSDAHFIVLDSNTWADFSTETGWLDSDLDSGKTWKFVMFHHPLYTSDPNHFGGWANLRTEWEGLFQTQGVDAVWNGHFHAYERYLENGIQYMVVGTGGAPLYQLSTEKYDGYQNSLESSLAYAKVTVDPADSTTTVQIIRVADVSLDNSQVTAVYPAETVFETFMLTHAGQGDTGSSFSDWMKAHYIPVVAGVVVVVALIVGVTVSMKARRKSQ